MYVAAGDQHSVAIRLDGTIIAQGLNTNQQSTSPAGNNYIKISAGYRHNLALKTDGSIITWGYDGSGLGAVPTVGSYVDISAGRDFSVALKTNTPPRKGSHLKAPKARLKLK